MEFIESLGDILGYLVSGALVLLGIIAAVRVAIKTSRGERVDIPAVGYLNDLPSSVTGINKHLDSDAINVNQKNKNDGE